MLFLVWQKKYSSLKSVRKSIDKKETIFESILMQHLFYNQRVYTYQHILNEAHFK